MSLTFVLYFVLPIVLGILILIVGAILWTISGMRDKDNPQNNLENWESTGGKVTSAATREDGGKVEPIVEYVYTVGEKEYHGSQNFAEAGRKLTRGDAEEILQRYRTNAYVPVRFNPQNPSEAVLESATVKTDWLKLAAYLLLAFGICVCGFTAFMGIIILGGIGSYM